MGSQGSHLRGSQVAGSHHRKPAHEEPLHPLYFSGWKTCPLRPEPPLADAFLLDLTLLGNRDDNLNALQRDPEGLGRVGPGEGEDDVPELPVTSVSVPGDLWQMGAHRLICGDRTAADVVGWLLALRSPGLPRDLLFPETRCVQPDVAGELRKADLIMDRAGPRDPPSRRYTASRSRSAKVDTPTSRRSGECSIRSFRSDIVRSADPGVRVSHNPIGSAPSIIVT